MRLVCNFLTLVSCIAYHKKLCVYNILIAQCFALKAFFLHYSTCQYYKLRDVKIVF